ncbi:MAG: hypothetical protein FJ102_26225, partial [Deltaproteobacteria bacterium]|nr:hypothetical protein [Deltaproteobacteria bacterium]
SHAKLAQDHIPGLYLGAWSSSVAYVAGDVLSKTGVIYRCILAHTNQGPPNATYWTAETSGGSSDHDALGKLGWPVSGHTGEALGLPVFGAGGGASTLSAPPAPRGNYVLGWTAAGALAWVALSVAVAVSLDPCTVVGECGLQARAT